MLQLNIFLLVLHITTPIYSALRNIGLYTGGFCNDGGVECTVTPAGSKRMKLLDEDDESDDIVQYLSPRERPAD